MDESISQLLAERGIVKGLVIRMYNVVEYFSFAYYFCTKYLETTPFYTHLLQERKEMCVSIHIQK